MKNQITIKSIGLLLLILLFYSCTQMTEYYQDKTAGINGGFEISKKGLPVNWLMYTPNTVPEGDFQIILDKQNFKEGAQSLKFDVKECASVGGWRSPGFTNEYFNKKEGHYKLSFWIINVGTEFSINAGGVTSKGGNMKNILKSNEQIENWKLFEFEIDVPNDEWLRIELNILKPGVFWIDDIKIDKIK